MLRRMLSCIALFVSFAVGTAIAQDKPERSANAAEAASSQPQVSAETPLATRQIKFDVISIHPTRPDERRGFEDWTPSGFSAVGADLWGLILQAYFGEERVPRSAVSGYPSWVTGQPWNIEAKVAPEDIAEYQRHQPKMADPPEALGWSLIRSLLAERFHLVVHRVPAEIDGYALVLAKSGPKMKPSPPDEPQPPGTYPNHGGYIQATSDGLRQNFYYFTMPALAAYLHWMDISVVDRTGLTGHYDFTLKWVSSGDENEHPGSIPINDPEPLSHYDFGALGVRSEHAKIPIDDVVVDHVDQPSEN